MDAAREFVAAAVYNNVPGPDAAMLKRFKEPAWNNPVLRYLDAAEKDLVPRQGREWTSAATLRNLAAALEKSGRAVPEYLRLSVREPAVGPAGADPLEGAGAYYYVPLIHAQAVSVSEALKSKKAPDDALSPTQKEFRGRIQAVLAKRPGALEALKPDRTVEGLPAYARALEKALAAPDR